MANYTTLPIIFTGLGADIGPVSYTTLPIIFTGNTITFGSIYSTTLEAIKLVRLQPNVGIGAEQSGIGRASLGGQANPYFTRNMNKDKDEIEKSINQIVDQVNQINEALAAAAAAQAAADAAAQKADEVEAEGDLKASYTDPLAIVSAEDTGLVTIAAHSRVYGNMVSVAVDGGTLPGQFGTVFIYYVDPMMQGGAVTYLSSPTQVAQGNSIHVVGAVTVPDVGSPPVEGGSPLPPGYVGEDSR